MTDLSPLQINEPKDRQCLRVGGTHHLYLEGGSFWSWSAVETSVIPPALPLGPGPSPHGDLVSIMVCGPEPQHPCRSPSPLRQCQASFFTVWFPNTGSNTHTFVELDARALQLTHLASLETCTPVYKEVLPVSCRCPDLNDGHCTSGSGRVGQPTAGPGAASQPWLGPRRT